MSNKTKKILAGTVLIREHDSSRKMYILKEGKVKVFKNYLGKKITLAVLGKGEVFGELSFFDAEPRSASVEALTDIEVLIIDGSKVEDEIKNLPSWVSGILKSVFYRFRETDSKLTILQNMYEFQKRTTSRDIVSQTIFLELLRYNKTLQLVFNDAPRDSDNNVEYLDFYKHVDQILGKKDIGLRAYFQTLIENNLLTEIQVEEGENLLSLNFDEIDQLNKYLNKEVESERYLVLSHSSIALLRACIGFSDDQESKNRVITLADLGLNSMPFYDDAVNELSDCGLIACDKSYLTLDVNDVQYHYVCQSIIKSFDHDVMQI